MEQARSMNEPTEGEKELSKLVADLKKVKEEKAAEKAGPENSTPPMVDRRSAEQRRLDCMAGIAEILKRDRCVLVPTHRYFPNGQQVSVEVIPFEPAPANR